jgi:hypothetical protein
MPAKMDFSISKEDMLRSKVVQPGVYVLLIKDINQGPGKNDPDSITTTVDFVIESGPDPKGIGVPLKYWISEKAAGLSQDFFVKVTGKALPDDGITMTADQLNSLIGRKVKAYLKPEKYQGKDQNKIDGFLPMSV